MDATWMYWNLDFPSTVYGQGEKKISLELIILSMKNIFGNAGWLRT